MCRDLAAAKGWPVADVYVDNDVSAYSGKKRPAYQAMCADIAAGKIDAVIVVDQDRLVRRTAELEGFIDLANAHGVALANVTGDLDLSTSDGRLTARIRGTVAQHESEKKAERIRRERAQRAARGEPSPGRRSFGYLSWRMEPHPVEAPLVVEASGWLLAGVPLAEVARRWNAAGVVTVNGRRWDTNAVRDAVVAPRHAGLRSVKDGHRSVVVGVGTWDGIVSRETYERLEGLLAGRRRPGRPPSSMLSGILRCGRCDAPMVKSGSPKDGKLYACRKGRRAWPQACGRLQIRLDLTDRYVAGLLVEAVRGGALARALQMSEADGTSGLVVELEQAEGRLGQLVDDHYVSGVVDRATFLKAHARLSGQVEGLRGRLARASAVGQVPVPVDVEGASDGELRRLAETLLDRVVCVPRQAGAPRRWDPSRLELGWRV